MSRIMLCLAIFFCLPAAAQDFPKSFVGHWEGELQWYRQGDKNPQSFRMQLIVQPADTPGHFSWHLVYGDKGADSRAYVLKPVDTAKGHWVIDERNGIVLDQYWVGGRFTGAFTVLNATILNTYRIEKDQLIVEFHSLPAKPLRTSGKGTEDSPLVESYAIKGYQQAVLKKKN